MSMGETGDSLRFLLKQNIRVAVLFFFKLEIEPFYQHEKSDVLIKRIK